MQTRTLFGGDCIPNLYQQPPSFYLSHLRSVCFTMQSPFAKDFKDQSDDNGEHICVRLPCVGANHLFQMSGGHGRKRPRKGGKQ